MIALWAAVLSSTAAVPYVLAVGVNQPNLDRLTPLEFADDDAASMVELFGARPDRSWLLAVLDPRTAELFPGFAARARPPTAAELDRAAAQIAQRVEADRAAGLEPVVIVSLTGHAARGEDGRTSFLLADGRLDADQLEAGLIRRLLGAFRLHLIVDSCYAEALVRPRAEIRRSTQGAAEAAFFEQSIARFPNAGVIAGASAGRRAFEWEEIGSGVFSALVRSAMRGAADADQDRAVSYRELAAYVSAASEGVPVPSARPEVIVVPPAIDRQAPISRADWVAGGATLDADLAPLGRFQLIDARGRWILGGRFEAGFSPQLWLPTGAAPTLTTDGGSFQIEADGQGWRLGPAQPKGPAHRGVVEKALQEGLFSVPFGPAYFRGYAAGSPAPSVVAGAAPPAAVEPWSTAAYAGAGVALVVAAAAGIVSAEAALAVDRTQLERPAHDAYQRYQGAGITALVALGAALLLGGAGFALGGW